MSLFYPVQVNVMRTYITVTISSEGAKASEINERFHELGFSTTLGSHDFVYDWKEKSLTADQVINFIDKVQTKLKGMNVMISATTIWLYNYFIMENGEGLRNQYNQDSDFGIWSSLIIQALGLLLIDINWPEFRSSETHLLSTLIQFRIE